jgi:hypothetical protein
MNPLCLANVQELACIYCCQELHADHLESVKAFKEVMEDFQLGIQPTEYNLGAMLIRGIEHCKTESDLRRNLSEVMSYKKGGKRFENIIDSSNKAQHQSVKKFYENRSNAEKQLEKTVKKGEGRSEQKVNEFICPILTFSKEDA